MTPTGFISPKRPHDNDKLADGAQHRNSGADGAGYEPRMYDLADHDPPPDTLLLRE